MRGTSAFVVICLFAACGAGDNRIDPGDLELRDLLGVSPEAASAWDADQRAAARRVLGAGLHDIAEPVATDVEPGDTADDRVARSLAVLDARRFAAGEGALGLVRVDLSASRLTATARVAPTAADALDRAPAPARELALSDRWDAWPALPGRGLGVLAAIAADAGAADRVIVAPAPRLPVIAAFSDGRLVVNPVVLAALEPEPGEVATTTTTTAARAAAPPSIVEHAAAAAGAGNPYTFYGSVEECAAAQRARCEACLPGMTCTPITTASDGNAECTMLAANDGRGYFLECINLALAISSVDTCTAGQAPGCSQNTHAADSLTDLEANAMFLDTTTCAMGLDHCLADIYGTPSQTYPGLVDGGTAPPPPPRSTSVSCGNSCSNNNTNCTASPDCSCSGPSCNNSLSCDSACSNSNHQGGGCGDACSSDSSSGSSGGGGCSSSSSSGSSGGSCGSCNNSSSSGSSGGSCGSCGSGGSSSSGSCGSCGSSSSSGSSSCGGGSGKCSVASAEPSASFALAASVGWGLLPVPFAALKRRKRRKPARDEEVVS